jgi:hypothetical protein
MKPPTKRQLEKMVRHYAPKVGAGDWTILVTIDDTLNDPPKPLAEVELRARTRQATIEFFPRHIHARPEDGPPGIIVLHELLHLPVWHIVWASVGCGEDDIPERVEWAEEHIAEPFLDSLARTLYSYLPKPRG